MMNRQATPRIGLAGTAMLALVLAGCGEGVEAAAADTAAAAPAAIAAPAANAPGTESSATVEMTGDLRYSPETVRIQAGETVTWRNTSEVGHTVTADPDVASDPSHVKLPDGAEPFNSGNVAPGKSYSRTFGVPGTYEYFCIPHESQGMLGTLIVE